MSKNISTNQIQQNQQPLTVSIKKEHTFFNWVYFKQTIKQNIKIWAIITICLLLLLGLMSYFMPHEIEINRDKALENFKNMDVSARTGASVLWTSMGKGSLTVIYGASMPDDVQANIVAVDTALANWNANDIYLAISKITTSLAKIDQEKLDTSQKNAFLTFTSFTTIFYGMTKVANIYAYNKVLGTMNKTVISNFISMIGTLLGMIYVIVVANGMLASQVDRGSLAYILSTPIKRSTVINTQLVYFVSSILLTCVLMYFIQLTCFLILDVKFDYLENILAFLGYALFLLAIGSIAYISSASCNTSKFSLIWGAGIPVVFYIINIMTQINEALSKLKYITINTLYNNDAISNIWGAVYETSSSSSGSGMGMLGGSETDKLVYGQYTYLAFFGVMLLISVVLFLLAKRRFCKRDLPL